MFTLAPAFVSIILYSLMSLFSTILYSILLISLNLLLKRINIVDSFNSAYRAGHSCEIALLRVYNDIVTAVRKGNGLFLVLLDLSAAFDTIDHDDSFYILEKYVRIGGSALRLIRSYFSDRTQRVQNDGIMSDFASLLCGVPQEYVQGTKTTCYDLDNTVFCEHYNLFIYILIGC